MIAFITSIGHPFNSNSYERIGLLLDRTLRSVCRQSVDDFVVIVVCNEKPVVAFDHPRVHYVQVEFPPASPERGSVRDMERLRLDKGTKYTVGLLHARAWSPHHVMFFDADDFVHRGIAEFADRHLNADGWYLDQGYVYWEGSARIKAIRNFHQLCGTSHIVAFRLLDLSGLLKPSASQEEIMDGLDASLLRRVLGTHLYIANYFNRQGYSIRPLPFPGAIYVRGTSENVSLHKGFPSILGTKITRTIREDFNLQPPEASLLRDMAASFGQSAFLERVAARLGGGKSALIEWMKSAGKRGG